MGGKKKKTNLPSRLQAKHHKAFPFPFTPAPLVPALQLPPVVPLPLPLPPVPPPPAPSLNDELFFLIPVPVPGELGGIGSGLPPAPPPSFPTGVVGLVTTVEAAVEDESVLERRRGRRKEEERLTGVDVLGEGEDEGDLLVVGEEGERVLVGEGMGEEGEMERGESVRGMGRVGNWRDLGESTSWRAELVWMGGGARGE